MTSLLLLSCRGLSLNETMVGSNWAGTAKNSSSADILPVRWVGSVFCQFLEIKVTWNHQSPRISFKTSIKLINLCRKWWKSFLWVLKGHFPGYHGYTTFRCPGLMTSSSVSAIFVDVTGLQWPRPATGRRCRARSIIPAHFSGFPWQPVK